MFVVISHRMCVCVREFKLLLVDLFGVISDELYRAMILL